MAEFLIYNRDSWLEHLSENDKIKFQRKYDRRKKRGDVVAIRPDGYKWSASELPKVIKRPDIKYGDAIKTEEEIRKVSDVDTVIALNIDKGKITNKKTNTEVTWLQS